MRQGQGQVGQSLKVLLADTYTVYLKTQNYHWNVTGPNFHAYHVFFEEQYKALSDAVDLIAERIRAVGEEAPASFQEYSKLKTIPEAKRHIDAIEMIKDLEDSHKAILKTLKMVLEHAMDEHDEGTIDLITERTRAHEKTVWMLKAHLNQNPRVKSIRKLQYK